MTGSSNDPVRNILMFGAYSAIAAATARRLALDGARFFLVGRDRQRLESMADDLKVRGAADTHICTADLEDRAALKTVVDGAFAALETVDLALIAHGTLPDQALCEADPDRTFDALNANMLSQIELLTLIANRMEPQQRGAIAAISSVAGDRGRRSNYVYGTAKGALSIFLQGLTGRLAGAGVHVLTVKPGFVDTPMTAAMPKGALWATPDRVASDIVRALERRKFVVYTPWFWWIIMAVIRRIPAGIFHKMNL